MGRRDRANLDGVKTFFRHRMNGAITFSGKDMNGAKLFFKISINMGPSLF